MTIPVSLVKVGNSKAFIIPSKILRQMDLEDNTEFELSLDSDSMIHIRKIPSGANPVFPKLALPKLTEQEMQDFYDNLLNVDTASAQEDERLAYILERQ